MPIVCMAVHVFAACALRSQTFLARCRLANRARQFFRSILILKTRTSMRFWPLLPARRTIPSSRRNRLCYFWSTRSFRPRWQRHCVRPTVRRFALSSSGYWQLPISRFRMKPFPARRFLSPSTATFPSPGRKKRWSSDLVGQSWEYEQSKTDRAGIARLAGNCRRYRTR
jgi:hypothetical protein